MTVPRHAGPPVPGVTGLPPKLCDRLWTGTGGAMAYGLFDAAADPGLVDRLQPLGQAMARCLLPGGPGAPAAAVAPWLVALPADQPFTQSLAQGLKATAGLLLVTSPLPLPPLWRHLRAVGRAQGPGGAPLWFRFHDPRVLRAFLATADPGQLAAFFGPLEAVYALAESGGAYEGWAFVRGGLQCQVVSCTPG